MYFRMTVCYLRLYIVHYCQVVVVHALIPVLRNQTQAEVYELKASLIYKVNSSTARAETQRNPVLKNKTKPKKNIVHYLTLVTT